MRQMIWLFFGFNGRIDRSVYALAGLLVFVVQMFIVYRYLMPVLGELASGDFDPAQTLVLSPMTNLQTGIFLFGQLAHIALGAKRIHDFGQSGFFALLFMFAGLIAYLGLCLVPGNPGPNKYGARRNAPK